MKTTPTLLLLALLCAPAAAASAAEKFGKWIAAAGIPENISEVGHDVFIRHASLGPAAAHLVHAGMAVPVVGGFFVGIAQYLISLGGLFETSLCILVVRIAVRVVLKRLFAVGFFYVVGVGIAVHAEHLVIISLGHEFNVLINNVLMS